MRAKFLNASRVDYFKIVWYKLTPLRTVEMITIATTVSIMEMKDVVIQFYSILASGITPVVVSVWRNIIPRSQPAARLNLDSPDRNTNL